MSRNQKLQNFTGRRNQTLPAVEGAPVTRSTPVYSQIAARAYEIFLARGGEHGRDAEDWYQAERELSLGRQ
jgi:hypothetical protein